MNRIEIYSNKKKAFLLLLGSIAFVFLGFFCFINAENMANTLLRKVIIKIVGIVTISFSGFAIFVSIKQLIKNKLMLVIDQIGISLNPAKKEIIKWENIEGFPEIKINGVKIIIIQVNNSEKFINEEESKIRKKLMKFNVSNYGSPFNISASTMNLSYNELYKLLKENLIKYKNIA